MSADNLRMDLALLPDKITGPAAWLGPAMEKDESSVPGDRPLPECCKERYGSIEIGRRGGIVTKETRLHAPLD